MLVKNERTFGVILEITIGTFRKKYQYQLNHEIESNETRHAL